MQAKVVQLSEVTTANKPAHCKGNNELGWEVTPGDTETSTRLNSVDVLDEPPPLNQIDNWGSIAAEALNLNVGGERRERTCER
jgi:hypothetical protein